MSKSETLQNMEKYADYMRCGEIYKSPSQSDRTPYILKCFRCADVFLLLESFIFHIEDYCQRNVASTSTAVTTVKSETAHGEQQQFSIELIQENYEGHEAEEYKVQEDILCIENDGDCELIETPAIEIKNEPNCILETDVDCELIEASPIEIKNEPIVDNDDVCVDAVDIYVSDVFDDDNDDQNEVELSCDEEVEHFGFQDPAEDTESADEDPIGTESDSSPTPFILNFMESPTNVLTFITTYKSQPKLWNKRLYPYSEEQFKSGLEQLTKQLNDQLKLGMPSNVVSEMISYLQRTFKEDLTCLRNSSEVKKHKPLWYFEYLRFLKPFVESNVFANLDKSLPPMLPEQIIEIINIYKTFPHLWDCSIAEYCCQNKRSESEVLMLRTIQFRINLKLTQSTLQKCLRCIHSYFAKEKFRQLDNITAVSNVSTTDGEPNYYNHLQFLNDHVGPFKCPDCDRLLKSTFLWKTHMSKHNGTTPLTCSVCNKGFKTIRPYVNHARRHMEDFHEECNMCGIKFLTSPELQSHMDEFHEACITCGKKFLTPSELQSHVATHAKAKKYNCEICKSSFTSILAFTNHKKVHVKRVQYKCRSCTKVFTNKAAVENHLLTHRSKGSHLCKTCGKTFTNPKALLVHETLHSDFKKYDCTKCSKVFKTKLSFDQHMRTHVLRPNI